MNGDSGAHGRAAGVTSNQPGGREPRPGHVEREAGAFAELARALAAGDPGFERRVVELASTLCGAGSAGLTTFEPGPAGYRLPSVVHGRLAARARPARCDAPLPGWLQPAASPALVREPAGELPFLRDVRPAVSELLVLPFRVNGRRLAAIWVAAHGGLQQFTAREARLLTTLGAFAQARLEWGATEEALRQAEEQLAQARDVGDNLLTLASHELRTPLTILKGDAALLHRHRQAVEPGLREQLLADMERDAERLQQVIENLLALARAEGAPCEVEPLLLERVLRLAVAEHHLRYPGHEVQVHVAAMPPVLGHEGYLRQVVTNLLANAARHAGTDQPVEVYGALEHGVVTLSVVDRGPGIAAGPRAKAFAPFQGAQAAEPATVGLGIGLAASRRLMEEQHGRLHVARGRRGAAVTCLLPVAEAPPED